MLVNYLRDIMDSLSKIGDLVRATEFIGQSSGLFFFDCLVFSILNSS